MHPKTGVLHNFGTVAGSQHRLALYEVNPAGQARIAHVIPMPDATFAHDFILTQSGHQIFFLVPVAFDVLRAFSGLTSPASSIRVNRSSPTLIIVVSPDGEVHRLQTDFGFVFHFINGYQDADGTLIVDALMLGNYPDSLSIKAYLAGNLPNDQPQARFTRYRIDLTTKKVTHQTLSDYEGELPEIHPGRVGQPYRYTWTIGRPPSHPLPLLDHLVKLDVQTGEARHAYVPDTLVSEPVVVPRLDRDGLVSQQEDDSYLVYLRFDAPSQTTELVVADAADLQTLARLRLPHNIPLGFHGMWQPATQS